MPGVAIDHHRTNLRKAIHRPRFMVAALFCGLVLSSAAQAAQPVGCLIEPRIVVELGSPVIGVLSEVYVDRGATIRKGQVLATLKADAELAAVRAAKGRAQAEADLKAALANRDYNSQKLVRAEDLVKKNFISAQALEQAKAEFEVAEQKLAQANEQRRIWGHEYETAVAQLSLRTLVSPINGIVVERYLSPGERVEEKPILKLVDPDPLRVELFMPTASYLDVKPGMVAKVYPDLPGAGDYEAKVVLVDRVVDPASNTFRVRLELPNPGNALPAGLRCKVAFGDQVVGGGGDSTRPPAPSAAKAPPAATASPAAGQPAVAKVPPATATSPPASPPGASQPMAAKVPVAAKPSSPVAAVDPDTDQVIRDAVESWRKAWAAKDLEAYVAAYMPDFKGDQASHEEWLKQRETRLGQSEGLQIGVRNLKIQRVSDVVAVARFAQRYRSAAYNDDTLKTLRLKLVDDQWRIEGERAEEKPRE